MIRTHCDDSACRRRAARHTPWREDTHTLYALRARRARTRTFQYMLVDPSRVPREALRLRLFLCTPVLRAAGRVTVPYDVYLFVCVV